MHVFITGGSGFLGQRLCRTLLSEPSLGISRVTLGDVVRPESVDARVTTVGLDVSDFQSVIGAVPESVDVTYHLAAVVSSAAEEDFDLGMKVNADGTRNMLEALRTRSPGSRVVFASSLAVYGSEHPNTITASTGVTPQSSYGTQKAVGELLLNDYSRRGFVDGLALRLPTVSIRPGRPNRAASSFASDIIREPIAGRAARCPVDPSLELWLTTPSSAVRSLVHAMRVPTQELLFRSLNAPGITITVRNMIDTLERMTKINTSEYIDYRRDEKIEQIVASWPSRIDTTEANELGFVACDPFEEAIRQHVGDQASA